MLLSLIACTPLDEKPSDEIRIEEQEDTATAVDTGSDEETDTDEEEDSLYQGIDPFRAEESQAQGLTNTDLSLEKVLEYGALDNACELYAEHPSDEDLKLLCGKAMFFYEGFDGLGIPQPLFDFINTKFPDEIGIGFTEYGMILDPYSEHQRPIGYGAGAPLGSVETLAYSCASCHFGQLPDGRYSVGKANYEYDAGKQFLALMLLPNAIMPGFNDAEHDPDAIAIISPMRQKIQDDWGMFAELGWNLLPLLWESDMSAAQVSIEVEKAYASWRPGTMDVFIPPLPIDDEVHVVSKIPTIWDMPTREEQEEYEMNNGAMLSWNGASPTIDHFVSGFIALSGSDTWDIADVEPLLAYLETLQAPKIQQELNLDAVERGRAIFFDQCIDCHQGFRGSSIETFSFDEIGTDDQMKYIMDPDLDGVVTSGLDAEASHEIKAPRLSGVWSKTRLLHNGSVDSLEELFCLEGERNDDTPIFGNQGHEYGCEMSTQEREDIITFLKSI